MVQFTNLILIGILAHIYVQLLMIELLCKMIKSLREIPWKRKRDSEMLIVYLTLTTFWPIHICSTVAWVILLPIPIASTIDLVWLHWASASFQACESWPMPWGLACRIADHRIWLGICMVVICGSSPQDSISFVVMIKMMLVVRDPFKLWKRKRVSNVH